MKIGTWTTAPVSTVAAFVTFGFRANSFTVIPALLVIIAITQKRILHKALAAAAVCCGLLLVILIPRALHIDTMSSVSLSFIWEMGENIMSMDGEKQAAYRDYLDNLFGPGSTERLVRWGKCEGIPGLEDKSSDEYKEYLIDTFGTDSARRLLESADPHWPLRRTASFLWELDDFSSKKISDVGLGNVFSKYHMLFPAPKRRRRASFSIHSAQCTMHN